MLDDDEAVTLGRLDAIRNLGTYLPTFIHYAKPNPQQSQITLFPPPRPRELHVFFPSFLNFQQPSLRLN